MCSKSCPSNDKRENANLSFNSFQLTIHFKLEPIASSNKEALFSIIKRLIENVTTVFKLKWQAWWQKMTIYFPFALHKCLNSPETALYISKILKQFARAMTIRKLMV